MFISTDLLVVSPAHIISTIVIKVVPADEIEWMYRLDGGNNAFTN